MASRSRSASSLARRATRATALALAVLSCTPDRITGPGAIGRAETAPASIAGAPQLFITEVMADPSFVADAAGEWFEVFNAGTTPINMKGWTVGSNGTEKFTVATDVVVASGGYAVFATSLDTITNGRIHAQYGYGSAVLLNNSNTDWLTLRDNAGILTDSVAWAARNASGTPGSFSPGAGKSRALKRITGSPSVLADTSLWAISSEAIPGSTDKGTPGYGPYSVGDGSGGGTPSTPTTVVAVTVTPAPATAAIGGTRTFSAVATDSANHTVSSATFRWSSANVAIATIDSVTGVARGVAIGTTTITARTPNGVTGTATLTVSDPSAPASISISTNFPARIPVGFTKPVFYNNAKDGNGAAISPLPKVTWASSKPDVATVDSLGYVTGRAVGSSVAIYATTANGVADTVFYTIIPAEAPTTAEYRNAIEFGTPTDADPSDDIILTHQILTESYNAARGGPNWVSWDLNATQFGDAPRCDCFSADLALPSSVYHVVDFDYRNGGYDRGHMAQSESRTVTDQENAATFLLTNILPQAAENNQGPWSKFEQYTDSLVRTAGKEVYLVAGPEWGASPASLKGEGKVFIPDYTWKVAVIVSRGQGLGDVRATTDAQVIAIRMPNLITTGTPASAVGMRNLPWQNYITTVDRIEAATGYDLLALLPDSVENVIESNDRPPVARATTSVTGEEGSAVAFDASTSTDPDGDALTYAWSFGDGTTGTGAQPTHAYADNGSYAATVVVRDIYGASSTATTGVSITNVAPTASLALPAGGSEGASFTLALTAATDPSSADVADGLQFSFDCGDGAGYGAWNGTPSTSCATTDNGTRAVRARVMDKDGASSEYAGPVEIANVAPTATFSATPLSVVEGSTFTLALAGASDASSADVAAGLTFAFDCGDGAGFGAASATTSASCATVDNATRTVGGRVTDKDGGVSTYSATVQVTNAAPVVALEGSSHDLVSGDTLALAGSFTDAGAADAPWQYAIAWGTGTPTTGSLTTVSPIAASRAYLAAGSYTATLTVTDKDGATGTASVQLLVRRRTVSVDAKPEATSAASNGKLKLVVLGDADVDAQAIDLATVRVNGASITTRGAGAPFAQLQDVNGDGRLDLVLRVERRDLGLATAGDVATLRFTADLTDGRQVEGTTGITIAGK